MTAFIMTAVVGVVCIILGISNMRGNISTLHSYHTHRVREEDKRALGVAVGLGTIICGASVIIFSILAMITIAKSIPLPLEIGYVVLGIGMAVGLFISLFAVIKYNKGLF